MRNLDLICVILKEIMRHRRHIGSIKMYSDKETDLAKD